MKWDTKSYEYYKGIYKDYPTALYLYRVIVLETKKIDAEKNLEASFEKYKTEFPEDKNYKKRYLSCSGKLLL